MGICLVYWQGDGMDQKDGNIEHLYDWRMVGLRMMVEIEVDEQEQWKWRVQNFHLLRAAHGLC